jgi:hypothetical protein
VLRFLLPPVTALVLLAGCSSSGSEAGGGPGGSPSDPAFSSPASASPSAPASPPRSAASVPSAASAASAASVPSADSSASEDVPGMVACGALASAINDGTIMHAGVVDAIVAAAAAADTPISDAAKRLAGAYATATAAVGTEDEPDAVADVSAVAADMSDVCGESGLDTVG